jgi:hypothetical protein
VWIGNIDFREAVIQGPEVRDWSSTIHHDDQGSFAADEIDEELEEGIDGECLDSLLVLDYSEGNHRS